MTELQRRYAAGELSDAAFEAKLERLIDADREVERADGDTGDVSLEADNRSTETTD